jgi:general secretion pathway protein G
MNSRRGNSNGFSLIELLIVLVVAGVLAAIALPAYQSYMLRLKNNQAILDIGDISSKIGRYYTANNAYPASLASLLGSTPSDPWGNPYQYLNIAAGVSKGKIRKDKNINPLNSDYDLYSMGADGLTSLPLTAAKSQDDIVRAGNGGFIGLATGF